ncbi:hypothetical protein ACOMHN_051291 [Nucella lapillus]
MADRVDDIQAILEDMGCKASKSSSSPSPREVELRQKVNKRRSKVFRLEKKTMEPRVKRASKLAKPPKKDFVIEQLSHILSGEALDFVKSQVTTLLDLTALGWPELLPPTSSRIFCCSKSLRASGERNSRGGRGGGVIGSAPSALQWTVQCLRNVVASQWGPAFQSWITGGTERPQPEDEDAASGGDSSDLVSSQGPLVKEALDILWKLSPIATTPSRQT